MRRADFDLFNQRREIEKLGNGWRCSAACSSDQVCFCASQRQKRKEKKKKMSPNHQGSISKIFIFTDRHQHISIKSSSVCSLSGKRHYTLPAKDLDPPSLSFIFCTRQIHTEDIKYIINICQHMLINHEERNFFLNTFILCKDFLDEEDEELYNDVISWTSITTSLCLQLDACQ